MATQNNLSPYWKGLHVEESRKILEKHGFDLQDLDKDLSKPTNDLCKNLFNAHVKRWGRGEDDVKADTKFYRSWKMKVSLEKFQKIKLISWMDCGRATYNMTLSSDTDSKTAPNKYECRNRFVTRTGTEITDEKHLTLMYGTPKDIQAKACFEYCIAKETALKNSSRINPKYTAQLKVINADLKVLTSLENKIEKAKKNKSSLIAKKEILEESISKLIDDLEFIHKYRNKKVEMKKRTRKNPYVHIFIPKSACTVVHIEQPDGTIKTFWKIYSSYGLGLIEINPKYLKDRKRRSVEIVDGKRVVKEWIEEGEGATAPTSDFQIQWSRRTNEWHIITSTEIERKEHVKNSHRTTVIDPGLRTALTCLDVNTGKMENLGENWVRKIKWRTREADRCKAISLKGLRGGKRFAALKEKRKYRLHEKKVRNIVDEMNKKHALHLLNNNDIVVLPKLNVKGILKKNNGIGRENNRNLSFLSPCRFHDYLSWKAMIAGKIVINQDEAYTTKTCFECGSLNDIGSSKTYQCNHCGNVCDRDNQACFNILSKYMGSYTHQTMKN